MAARTGFLRPLRERDFAFLWFGQAISLVGDGVFTITLALQTLELSPRPTALATVLAARALPRVLFLLVAGAVSDRLPRRRTALVSDGVRGVAVGAIAILAGADALELSHLVAMAIVFGTADAFFLPTMTAIVPEVLPAELLVAGSGLNSTARRLGEQLLGPALGGLLVGTVGTEWAFALDATSFGVSAACLLAMRARPAAQRSEERRSVIADAREGLRYTRSIRWLWVSLLGAGVGNLAFSSMPVLIPLIVRNEMGLGAGQLGTVYAGFGVGGLAAGMIAARLGAPRKRVLAMWGTWAASGLLLIALGVTPILWLLVAFAVVCAFLLEYGNVLWTPLMQEYVPARLLGRVSALDWLFSFSLTPLGIAAAGPLAGAFGPRATLVAGGIVATCLVVVLLVPGVRDPDRA